MLYYIQQVISDTILWFLYLPFCNDETAVKSLESWSTVLLFLSPFLLWKNKSKHTCTVHTCTHTNPNAVTSLHHTLFKSTLLLICQKQALISYTQNCHHTSPNTSCSSSTSSLKSIFIFLFLFLHCCTMESLAVSHQTKLHHTIWWHPQVNMTCNN